MATSQFTIYRYTDANAPLLYGTSGSLITVLDACLVNGYGTKPGAGWTKPLANTGSYPLAPSIKTLGCWQQGTGSALTLFINDGAPNPLASYREAWATGWESISSLSSSVTNSCATGSGMFPFLTQSLTTGHVVIRKCTSADSSSARPWIVAADSSSMYLFVQTGDQASPWIYYSFAFGDIYSFESGSNDAYKCIIIGRTVENSNALGNDTLDQLTQPLSAVLGGHFIARSYSGVGISTLMSKHGDGAKGNVGVIYGNLQYPNCVDLSIYLSPIWIVEPLSSTIRGQLRGLYQLCHPIANFGDNAYFSGSLDGVGKTFLFLKQSANSGIYVIETSNTVLTN